MTRPRTRWWRTATIAVAVAAVSTSIAGGAAAAAPATAPTAPTASQQSAVHGRLPAVDLATRAHGAYPQYRIAAMTTTTRGTVLAAFDGRSTMSDLPSRIDDLVRRSTDGGRTWQPVRVVRGGTGKEGFGDPSLLTDRRTGRVFVFYAAGINEGFAGSTTGNDPNDPNVLQTDFSYSDDDGLTWHARRITPQIKDPSWGGLFAASGQGIQLQHGPYAGRLIQQYVIRIGGQNYAASAYSDDDGGTWRMGTPVGPGMDENKTVELADGTVMLNSRATPYRLVAYSHDGGVTYSTPQPDRTLIDPGDNGSIIRYAPNAAASDPRSHWLLFSNNADTGLRRNLTVRLSCDDGQHWPASLVIDPASAAYSTLTVLPDGRIGLFYERDGYQRLTFTSFALDRVGNCAGTRSVGAASTSSSSGELRIEPVLDHLDAAGPAGVVGDVATWGIRVTNLGDTTLDQLRLSGLDHLGDCPVVSLAPGASTICRTGTHTLSAAEVRARRFETRVVATAQTSGGATVRRSAPVEPVVIPGPPVRSAPSQ